MMEFFVGIIVGISLRTLWIWLADTDSVDLGGFGSGSRSWLKRPLPPPLSRK
jgi:hypothetical protein